jgi:alpha-L-fucosidase 2
LKFRWRFLCWLAMTQTFLPFRFNTLTRIMALLGTVFFVSGCSSSELVSADDPPTPRVLWSDEPLIFSEQTSKRLAAMDKEWSQTVYPIGNGRLGGTVFGDPDIERIQFNEDSLWLGNEDHTGGYQPFGDLYVKLGHKDVTNYRRQLDLNRAVQTVTYNADGTNYKREFFASHPAQVMVFRFSGDKPGALSGEAWLDSMHRAQVAINQGQPQEAIDRILTSAQDETLALKGQTKDLFWWRVYLNKLTANGNHRGREYGSREIINLDYEAQVRVLHEGGSISTQGEKVIFKGCDRVTFLLAADTNYLNEREKGWRGEHPHERITQQLDAAEKKTYDQLLAEHIEDYQNLFNRFSIQLGESSEARRAMTTAARVESYTPGEDPELESLVYDYARYLMISCSRPGHGALPANLQGLWLFHLRPAWLCDYHTDINLQMNYWFVQQANLAECFIPLAEWVDSIREVRKEETRKVLGVERGWLMRSENGVFGGSTYYFQKGDSAWIAQNLWDHYAFTMDKDYLRNMAYPIMKEICEFWFDHLKELPDGTLVVPEGTSPEHGPKKMEDGTIKIVEGHRTQLDGVSYDQQMCWDLFTNTIEASEALGIDSDFRAQVEKKREKLLGPQIGRWGQLQEWMEDIDDPNNQHRHVSHMLAVYPGRQIYPPKTPEFAKAANVSLIARGNGKTGWSKVFKACAFARLFDSDNAYRLIADVLDTKTHPNLWTTHPPFQIDCNFGYAAGINEMIMQSHMGYINLLPALPEAWKTGNVKGMRARGGYELDLSWKDGKLTQANIKGITNSTNKVKVRYAGKDHVLEVAQGQSTTFTP